MSEKRKSGTRMVGTSPTAAAARQRELNPFALNVRAYFRQLSGKEVFAAATTNYKEEVLFTINYRTDITPAHVVRYRDVLYDITRIDTFEGYKEDLTLYCSRRAK